MDITLRCTDVNIEIDATEDKPILNVLLQDIEVDRGTIIDLVRAYRYSRLLDFVPREEIIKYLEKTNN